MINDFAKVNSRYHASLKTYINVCRKLVVKKMNFSDPTTLKDYYEAMLKEIMDVFGNGYEFHDRILFGFWLSQTILKLDGFRRDKSLLITPSQLNFIMCELQVNAKFGENLDNPCAKWLPDENWLAIKQLSKLPVFVKLVSDFQQLGNLATNSSSDRSWEEIWKSMYPQRKPLPERLESTSVAEKLMLLKGLKSPLLSSYILD